MPRIGDLLRGDHPAWARATRQTARSIGRLAAVIGAVTVVAGAAIYVGHAVNRKWFWRDSEYAKLTSLVTGMSLDRFDHVLGSPVFVRSSANDRYRESTFQGRDYWVQTVSDRDGTVVEYAVTSCDDGFAPTIALGGTGHHVTLRRSRFSEVDREAGRALDYFVSGTGVTRAHLYDEDLGGNGSYYKQLAWGFNDACLKGVVELDAYISQGILKIPSGGGRLDTEAPWIERFRRLAVTNTYAETGPNVTFDELNHLVVGRSYYRAGFEIGVDRALTRLTQPRTMIPGVK